MIKIHNDGKGKHMSWEARAEVSGTPPGVFGFMSFNAIGYGATEDEAVEDLKSMLGSFVSQLNDLDYSSRTRIKWDGMPVDPVPNPSGIPLVKPQKATKIF